MEPRALGRRHPGPGPGRRPAKVQLLQQRGGAAERVRADGHGVAVEVARLGAVDGRDGEVGAGAVGVAVGARGDGDAEVGGLGGGEGEEG